MKQRILFLVVLVLTAILLSHCEFQNKTKRIAEDNATYINPFINTGSDHGQTDVAAAIPFGMVKPCPDTNPIGHSGYDFDAEEIIGFSNTRFSGVGCRGTGGNIRVLPFAISNNDTIQSALKYAKDSEVATAGFYKVVLENNVEVALTSTRQVAYHNYTFPKSEQTGLVIDLASSFTGHVSEAHSFDTNILSGEISTVNVCRKGKYTIYYALSFSKQIESFEENNSKMQFNFSTEENETIELRVALSTVSKESALKTLKTTSKSFEEVKDAAYESWKSLTSVVTVESENEALKELFYTQLYHATQSPFVIQDSDGSYKGSDAEIYTTEGNQYHGWSIWDTFRSKLPLLSFLYPEKYKEMMYSLKELYKQGKPDWATETEPFLTIRTEHSIVVLLEAYKKGLLPFSLEEIYEEMKVEAANLPFKSPDNVLESSFDLWAMSEIAKELGKEEEAKYFASKAYEYKTLWKDKFLNMDENSDIMHGDGLYEGTLWQYRWFVPFDINGVQEMIGSSEKFEEQLDFFFENELFNIGNQPDIQVPYLYTYTKSPWKTQKLIDELINTPTNNWYGTHKKFEEPIHKKIFTNTPNGYIEQMDDDAGTMSSWYVWSTMGLYPVFPGSTQMALTTPQFDSITIKTSNKPLQIIAKNLSSENIYIQKVTWNGAEIESSTIDFNVIATGGTLQFELGSTPNKNWGLTN